MKKMLFLGFLLSACGGITATEQVQVHAAGDLRCDASQIQTAQVDENTVRATGCGQERTYTKDCAGNATHCNWVSSRQDSAGKPADAVSR